MRPLSVVEIFKINAIFFEKLKQNRRIAPPASLSSKFDMKNLLPTLADSHQTPAAKRQKSSKNFTAQNPAPSFALALLALLAGSARRAAHSSLAATALALAGASGGGICRPSICTARICGPWGGGVGKELADKLAGLRGAVWTSKNARVVGTRVNR